MVIEMLIKAGKQPVTAADVFTFNQERCLIGRHRSDVWLSDARCSKQHAVIYEDPNGDVHVRDLDSRNGTFVNGQRIADIVVHVGDEIRVGRTCLLILGFKAPNRDTTLHGEENLSERLRRILPESDEIVSVRPGPAEGTASRIEVLKGWPRPSSVSSR